MVEFVPSWFEAVVAACKDVRNELAEFIAHVRECQDLECPCRKQVD